MIKMSDFTSTSSVPGTGIDVLEQHSY